MQILRGDGSDYNILIDAVKSIKDVPGLTCEIGVYLGGGSSRIMNVCKEINRPSTHIAVDPYGDIDFESGGGPGNEFGICKLDYTNEKRNQAIRDLFNISIGSGINFLFFNMEDTEFFKRFNDGVPIYNEHKYIINYYALAFIDGMHSARKNLESLEFFKSRMPKNAMLIYDNVSGYKWDEVESKVLESGFEKVVTNNVKSAFRKL